MEKFTGNLNFKTARKAEKLEGRKRPCNGKKIACAAQKYILLIITDIRALIYFDMKVKRTYGKHRTTRVEDSSRDDTFDRLLVENEKFVFLAFFALDFQQCFLF